MTFAPDGYKYAVESAIDAAADDRSVEFFRGMAYGLHLWAGAATKDQWLEDSKRIADAREKSTMTEGV